jgi:hypothetical protein
MLRRLFAASVTVAALAASDAGASVSIQVTWDGLLRESTAAAVVTPTESQSVWEGGRIYTYTHVHVDRAIVGDLTTGADVMVRTMGGVVGKIGQRVEGEAVLAPGHASLLFLHTGGNAPAGVYQVTARGQGQFPVVAAADPATPPHLVKSTAAGVLLAPNTVGPVPAPVLAADVVHGRLVDDVAADVAAAWGRAHAK